MSRERGGRTREAQEREAQEAEAARVKAKERLNGDLRQLMPNPAFQRFLQYLMAKCGTFDSVEVLTAEAYRIAARRHVGVEICKDLADADRATASTLMIQMLYDTLTPEEQE